MTPPDAPMSRAAVLGLVAMALAVLVVANDFTALSVALPAIEQSFGADVTTVQWVINGYALVFGVLIVTGGRLADMFGRRRICFLGEAGFGNAIGPLLGGALTDTLGWRWIFFLNLGSPRSRCWSPGASSATIRGRSVTVVSTTPGSPPCCR